MAGTHNPLLPEMATVIETVQETHNIKTFRVRFDDEEKMKSDIEKALNLLELNYIGGSGSRGYGRVKVLNLDSESGKLQWKEALMNENV